MPASTARSTHSVSSSASIACRTSSLRPRPASAARRSARSLNSAGHRSSKGVPSSVPLSACTTPGFGPGFLRRAITPPASVERARLAASSRSLCHVGLETAPDRPSAVPSVFDRPCDGGRRSLLRGLLLVASLSRARERPPRWRSAAARAEGLQVLRPSSPGAEMARRTETTGELPRQSLRLGMAGAGRRSSREPLTAMPWHQCDTVAPSAHRFAA